MSELKELSALDLHKLLIEFEGLNNSKVENVYQIEGTLFIVLHISGEGKKILKIMPPKYIYITEYKENMPVTPPQFCSIVRKYLKNARLRKIEQIDFERIIKLNFTSKDQEYNLIVELFSTGNVILCNKDMKIIYPMTHQKWKDRVIKGGQEYIYPKKEINILEAKESEIREMLSNSKMDSIVTLLAKEMGFGGKYAEEICKKGDIDKKDAPQKISAKKLMKVIKEVLDEKTENMNQILDETLTKKTITEEKEKKDRGFKEKKSKTETILNAQETSIKKQEQTVEESNTKADLIYKNYNEIQKILDELKEIKKKHTWKEIKEKLKGHKVIKSLNEKTGKITLNLD